MSGWIRINAKAMVHEIEEALVEADPDNAATYEANAEAVSARLDALIADVSSELEPVKGKGFIVFHDGYQYFENRFGITASGSITVSPEVMPGAERITEIRARVQELGAACVFAEPQFEPKLVSTVIEGTNARSGTLDPLGAGLEDGAELYFQLIRNMSTSIKTCLTEAS
jgi:zinc transport system substrate-binding protein